MQRSLTLSLLLPLALAACDAAVVANVQQDQPPPDSVAAEAVEKAEIAEQTVNAAVKGDGKVEVKAEVDVKATIEPAALDLESISFLVKKGKVKNAAELEKKINNPKEKLNNVDIDGDGKVDKIVVVEVQKPNDVKVFELKVVPSKTKDKDAAVVIAYINFEPDKSTKKLLVKAVYAPIVIGYDTIVYDYYVPIEVQGETIVVVDSNPFYGWVFLSTRPAYVGVFVYEVAPPPVIVIEHGGCWPPGHCKHWHGKHKHKHKHKGKW